MPSHGFCETAFLLFGENSSPRKMPITVPVYCGKCILTSLFLYGIVYTYRSIFVGIGHCAGDGTHNKKQRSPYFGVKNHAKCQKIEPFAAKGRIPIEKNIIVADENGFEIGRTYPKRAKGLIKNGRAEAVDDRTIRILSAHAPPYINTEDLIMSKYIDFDPRDFRFDSNAGTGAGSRMVVSDHRKNPHMIFELGDWNGRWSQIICRKSLERNTDYVFRFAVSGGFDDWESAVSRFTLFPYNDWGERVSYPLERCRCAPIICKRCGGTLLRVYEIPFNTGNISEYGFVFVSQKTVAEFFKAEAADYYSDLEDLDYSGWWQERQQHLDFCGRRRSSPRSGGMGNAVADAVCNAVADIANAGVANSGFPFKNMSDSFFKSFDGGILDISNENLSDEGLAKLLGKMDDGGQLKLTNVNAGSSEPEEADFGTGIDGGTFGLSNCHFTENAFAMLLEKMGDGFVLTVSNIEVDSGTRLFGFGCTSDGMCITIHNSVLSFDAAVHLISILGDGCVVDMINCTVNETDIGYEMPDDVTEADGMVITLTNCNIPEGLKQLLTDKQGDGCSVTVNNNKIN